MSRIGRAAAALVLGTLAQVGVARAQTATAEADSQTGASLSADAGGFAAYGPEAGLLELGLFGGVLVPSKNHNFHDETRPQQRLSRPTPELGLRLAYFPLAFAGAEIEGAAGLSKTEDDESATTWAGRGHLVVQHPSWKITPFAVGGFGRMGALSDSLGDDSDPAWHFGLGVKAALSELFLIRLDLRDTLTQKNRADAGKPTHHPEALLGLSIVLGRSERKHTVSETPEETAIGDADGDGINDELDRCPSVRGVAPDGCPAPDRDGDGLPDAKDQCPTQAGDPPDGCPDQDPDRDGVLGDTDKCPNERETTNGYQDEDGCPDEVPEQIKPFTGTIEGIYFETGTAAIRPASRPKLDQAVKVLKDHPDIKLTIVGHTDDRGTPERNLTLSLQRAEAVKKYLVSKGIETSRLTTRGAGEDEPVDTNATPEGRQKNRRIEFKLSR